MYSKNLQAFIIGFILWLFGVSAILLFGDNPLFIRFSVVAAFITAPVVYYLTKFHLREVAPENKAAAAIQFGIIITLVQFPLDLLIWLSSFNLGYPSFSQKTTEAIIIVLLIAYFLMLAVPWLLARRIANSS